MSKKKKNADRQFTSPDGTSWVVDVRLPSHSSAMVLFVHPDGRTARKDRYNWYQADVPQARDVESRLEPKSVLDRLDEETVALLFRRSMPVSSDNDPLRGLRN
ncbi:MAG TPA: hypothetical protein VJ672_06565 [Gemmatimonadaceae bacterium]|nr:hypothetical protein [Gemmatimonadaceae bacterium]